jgi:phage terminase large subunit-like protein
MRTAARDLEHQTRSGAHLTAQTPDGAFVFHEWSLSDADDRNDLKLVKEANPASWQTVAALAQRHNSPSMTSWAWARFACGVWLQGEGAAIEPAEWDDLANPDIEIPKGAHVLIGLDLGWKYDTTALVPLWWKADDERVICPPIVLTPPGDGTLLDDRLIVKALLDLRDRYTIEAVVYDPNAGGQQLVQQLEREHRFTFVEHSQDNSPISLADGRFMEAIRRRDLVHTGDEQLRQQVLNAVEKPLGGDRFRFDRSKRGPRKPIDALRAVSMAHSVAVAQRDNPKRSKRLVSF